MVSITVERLPSAPDMAMELDSLRTALPASTVRPAHGVGTQAFFLDIPNAGTQLHIIRGEHDHVMISVLGFGDAAQVSAAAERLARKALSRL
jgi:hypothetical protein